MQGLDEVTRQFVKLFEAQAIPYALMGGLAVRIHALPRPTFDVDFTILLARTELPRLYQHVEELGFTMPEAQRGGWLDAVRGLPVVKFQIWGGDRAIDVDVFLAETAYQRELLGRRQRHPTDGFEAWFVSPEDLVLLKLLANRPKDRVDVGDILFIQGSLDKEYMRRWARELGVDAELEAALQLHS